MKYPICEKLNIINKIDGSLMTDKFFRNMSYDDVLDLEFNYGWDGKSTPTFDMVEKFLTVKNPYLVTK